MLSYLFLLLCLTSAAADDLAALRRFRDAVGGRTRLWNLSAPNPCSFPGVFCNLAGRVAKLRLPAAGLSGQLPTATLGNLTALRILSLRGNSLSGRLPADLPPGLQSLYLQDNNFSSEIPETLFCLSSLQRLVLSGNRISKEISPEFNRLGQLQILYLQNNDLSGSIPELNNLTKLRLFNVSYNNLTGSIPRILQKFNSDSFIDTSLCGLPMSPCDNDRKKDNRVSAGAIAGIVIGSVIGLIAFLVILFILWSRHGKSSSVSRTQPRADTSPATPELPELEVLDRKYSKSSENGITYGDDGMVLFEEGWGFGLEDLLRASAEILGKGTIGSSYRAYLGSGAEVVVKRLRNVCVGEREFRERVEGFGRLRHENLVVVKGYYFGKEEKLVVYESLPLGSLASLLHGYRRAEMAPLTWDERVRIASGAARGICYLHSKGDTSFHGNIKSSNILLTDKCIARVSEFCINQLVSNTSTLRHNGYCAPEVTDTCRVSPKADVYSFGVVLLELVSGRAPDEGGMDLPRWIQTLVKEKDASVFDDELVRSENEKTDEMVSVLQLGIECTSIHPDKRPVMMEVATTLEELNRWR